MRTVHIYMYTICCILCNKLRVADRKSEAPELTSEHGEDHHALDLCFVPQSVLVNFCLSGF